ncbi:MAG: methyl-accepting chemotaxis protein, partial [Arcobacter sp.]|nr:methyl-accepting chemotaxis protein [Arcobacter sp.]
MFRNATIKSKILVVTILSLVSIAIIISIIAIKSIEKSIVINQLEKLDSIRVSKQSHIEHYLKSIGDLLLSLSNSKLAKDSLKEFSKTFYLLESEQSLDIEDIKKQSLDHYNNKYLNKINYEIPNSEQRKSTQDYLPKNNNALIAQHIFIIDNKEKIGEKNKLIYNDKYKSSYLDTHRKYHKSYDMFLNKFNLYDIFIVDKNGTLIYTDFKEKDFATNLYTGIYNNTGIAKAFKKAINLKKGQIAFDDFSSYEPSYNQQASFIATPIVINNNNEGVLIFQMPINEINKIMNFNHNYKEAGLEETGQSYLVGKDFYLKNDTRFLKNINNKLIKKLNTTIGLLKVETESVKNAFLEKKGNYIIKNYLNVNVLSSYSLVNVFNSKWAIIAEIEEEEVLHSLKDFEKTIFIFVGLSVLIIIIFYYLLIIRIIIQPINKLKNGLESFFKYLNKEIENVDTIDVTTKDEIGSMVKVINSNIIKTKDNIDKDKKALSNFSEVLTSVNLGELSKRVTTESSNIQINVLKNLINDMLNMLQSVLGKDLNDILEVLDSFANSKFDKKVINPEGEIEIVINQLGNIINQLVTDVKFVINTVENGDFENRLSTQNLDGDIKDINTGLNTVISSIQETFKDINTNMKKVSSGDLTVSINEEHKGEYLVLAKAINNTIEQIKNVIQTANNSTTQIVSGLDEVSSASSNLSRSATSQASSLEETSVAIEEMASNIKISTDNIHNTSAIAKDVSVMANDGGTSV